VSGAAEGSEVAASGSMRSPGGGTLPTWAQQLWVGFPGLNRLNASGPLLVGCHEPGALGAVLS
jgi:hypothetical protein